MIDHTGIGVADIARSAAFYDAALGALGLRRVMQLPENDGADGVGSAKEYLRENSRSVRRYSCLTLPVAGYIVPLSSHLLPAGDNPMSSSPLGYPGSGYPDV